MVTLNDLLPYKLTYTQVDTTFTAEMKGHGQTILEEAIKIGVGFRGAVIGVATAVQESGLRNLDYGDRDSLGLFQQRPSMGWGTREQILNPHYAAWKFFSVMKADCPGKFGSDYLTSTQLYQVAQEVQRSGFPTYYAKHEESAAKLVVELVNKLGLDDDPPKRVSLARKTDLTIKRNTPTQIPFEDEYSDGGDQHPDKGGPGFIASNSDYIALAAATLTGIAPGIVIQTRFLELNGKGETVKEGPIEEHTATTGNTYINQTRAGAVCDPGNRVVWTVEIINGDTDGKLTYAEVQANYWPR
ncbi:hypothetical protein ABZ419_13835 [Streptomyces cinnamoneus]|uniref:hypothetical protein n=1 Tax=Streptomyces cinnamoneus TaxID=53446 RepID=UPI0033E76C58